MSALCLRSPGLRTAAAAAAAPPPPPAAADTPGRLRLAIVGDVHGAWRGDREEAALRLLAPDATLLVGDFGNEDVGLVAQVAGLPLRKAVILGNHDAWYTMTGRSGGVSRRGAVQQTLSAADLLADMMARGGPAAGGSGSAAGGPAAPPPAQDGVRQQLAALGSCHVGYGTMRLDEHGYTVMGARPFSKGGKNFSTIRAFMEGLYGVTSMDESAERIVQVAQSAPPQHGLVVMCHNGPAGLGSRAFDICGVDWESANAGDHGDPDLQAALAALHRAGRRVALVTFGHMHHTLHSGHSRGRASRFRRMVALDPVTRTVFLNAATVPRVVPAPTTTTITPGCGGGAAAAAAKPPTHGSAGVSSPISLKSFGSGRRARMAAKAAAAAAAAAASGATVVAPTAAAAATYGGSPATQHHFMLAVLDRGEVVSARDVWVQVTPVTDGTAAAVLEAATSAAAAAAAGPRAALDREESADGAGSDTDGDAEGEDDEAAAAAALLGPRRIGNFVVQVVRDHVVLRTVAGVNGGVVKFIWNAYDQVYESYILEDAGAAGQLSRDGSEGDGGERAVQGGVSVTAAAAVQADGLEPSTAAPAAASAAMTSERVAAAAAVVVSGLGR